jgi:microsomal dipeptidase-like Zn-dependent dipeptidase
MYYANDFSVFKDGGIDVTYEKMGGYDTYLGTFAMYFDATLEQAERLTAAEKYLAAYAHMLASYDIKSVKTSADLKELTGRGALLSIENACFFEDDEADLARYWAAGVRILSMTHFKDSQFGCGNAAGDTPDKDTGRLFRWWRSAAWCSTSPISRLRVFGMSARWLRNLLSPPTPTPTRSGDTTGT